MVTKKEPTGYMCIKENCLTDDEAENFKADFSDEGTGWIVEQNFKVFSIETDDKKEEITICGDIGKHFVSVTVPLGDIWYAMFGGLGDAIQARLEKALKTIQAMDKIFDA